MFLVLNYLEIHFSLLSAFLSTTPSVNYFVIVKGISFVSQCWWISNSYFKSRLRTTVKLLDKILKTDCYESKLQQLQTPLVTSLLVWKKIARSLCGWWVLQKIYSSVTDIKYEAIKTLSVNLHDHFLFLGV